MGPESLLIEQLADALDGRWLVTEQQGAVVADAITERGAEAVRWSRYAWVQPDATARPPAGPFTAATLALPKGKEALAYAAESIAGRLEADAPLYLYGHNDAGIKSAARKLRPWFHEPETLHVKNHSRLWRLIRTDAPTREQLDDFTEEVMLPLPGGEVPFTGFPGLFAKRSLDPATALLANALQHRTEPVTAACDFACGMGVLSRVVLDRWPEASIVATDADSLAIEATRRNIPSADVRLMDGWQLPSGPRFDLIVSNPPIHVGQRLELGLVRQLVQGAARCLARGGQLALVVQRQRPIERDLAPHFDDVQIVAEDARFRVWVAR